MTENDYSSVYNVVNTKKKENYTIFSHLWKNFFKEMLFMKFISQKIRAAKIEYHWMCIKLLRKKQHRKENPRLKHKEEVHRFKAEQLSIAYEFYMGLRDWKGKAIR